MIIAIPRLTLPWRALMVTATLMLPPSLAAAPAAEPWAFWQPSTPDATVRVDHRPWQALLDRYLDADHPSGIHRFDYGRVSDADRDALAAYLASLAATDPRALARAEQQAYWINLYNAATVDLVLRHYPLKSIRDIGGLLSGGPWDREVATVAGQALTLNDIEHRILRPFWDDPRIHYAVNCASLGCPNLARDAYTAANLDALLDAQARAYVNHPRGVAVEDGRLTLSRIYDWYGSDFGDTREALLDHLRRYADDSLRTELEQVRGRPRYRYDWAVNAP